MKFYYNYIKRFLNPLFLKKAISPLYFPSKKSICYIYEVNIGEIYEMNQKPILAAFDFDHTVVDDNSDIVVRKLLPNAFLTNDVNRLYRQDGWTIYMARIFELLHQNGVAPSKILDAIASIPPTPGIEMLFSFLNECNSEVIIISDSNTVFINHWIQHYQLKQSINAIFSNPAHFDEKGLLHIKMYHLQDWCQLSTKNLCKGYILEDYIKKRASEGVEFSKIAYIGDGKNDLCPILKLGKDDLAFARQSYALIDCIQEVKPLAKVKEWKHASEIVNVLKMELSPTENS